MIVSREIIGSQEFNPGGPRPTPVYKMEVLGDHSPRMSLIKALYVLGYLKLVRRRWKRLSVSEMRDSDSHVTYPNSSVFYCILIIVSCSNLHIESSKHSTRKPHYYYSFFNHHVFVKLGALGLVFFHRTSLLHLRLTGQTFTPA